MVECVSILLTDSKGTAFVVLTFQRDGNQTRLECFNLI